MMYKLGQKLLIISLFFVLRHTSDENNWDIGVNKNDLFALMYESSNGSMIIAIYSDIKICYRSKVMIDFG